MRKATDNNYCHHHAAVWIAVGALLVSLLLTRHSINQELIPIQKSVTLRNDDIKIQQLRMAKLEEKVNNIKLELELRGPRISTLETQVKELTNTLKLLVVHPCGCDPKHYRGKPSTPRLQLGN